MITTANYRPTATGIWTGRTDGTSVEQLRWHQVIRTANLLEAPLPPLQKGQKGIAFLGFASDEGVRRNKGRAGAAEGPVALRNVMGSFPVHFPGDVVLLDAGDVICVGKELENAQAVLAQAVLALLNAGYFPVLLGGGHEITYGHVTGLRQYAAAQQLGYINFDAHFDIRIPEAEGASSGTGFWQLAQDSKTAGRPFHYLALGIQQNGNTRQLFNIAGEEEVTYVGADAFHLNDKDTVFAAIQHFLSQVDKVYLTTCMDVFASAFAPGVSATAYNGILPNGLMLQAFRQILGSGKVISADVAELNPSLDVDNRTAKLAASLIFEIVMAYCGEAS
ncbi:formiminoglutamase [Chitinophaga terrae (ex Kim and Jung 2007)]|uniref:formimidoylglutamase n=1 Tax=Chitinophaga terrae (ex Kim and Jung 2007) TaxID=408074 RepID=UPI002781EB6C|nr:formimidoylglutamase [Chitinophaga terrae (ex Kim and Jung 2007)]MDQ0108181.1 formiminoglutamase [Chitinophaga terrae (ex Kim and Jung 2007)]